MARRKGFLERFNPARILGNIARGVGRIFEPERPSRRAPRPVPPSPPPPPRPPRPGTGGGGPDLFRQAWAEETLSRPGRKYRAHREIFDTLPGMAGEPESEQLDIWRLYLRHIVSGNDRRNDPANPFWGAAGIDPRDFDWDGWRTAMGYKSRKR